MGTDPFARPTSVKVAKRHRDTIKTVDRDGLLSALHLADKLAAETRAFAESGLAIVSTLPEFSETLTEKLPNVGNPALRHDAATANRCWASDIISGR
jgi:hypothetical protein